MCLLFFSLSKYVLIVLLTEWLESKDLVQLDSSLSNAEGRHLFLSLMENYRKPFQSSLFADFNFNQHSEMMFLYAKNRGFDLGKMILVMNTETMNEMLSKIEVNDRAIRQKFAYLNDVKMIEVTGNAKETKLVARLLPCLPQLEYLKISGSSVVEKVGLYCTSLLRLEIGPRVKQASQGRLAEIFRNCKNLNTFKWESDNLTNRTVHAMTVHCQSLHTVEFAFRSMGSSFLPFLIHGACNKWTHINFSPSNSLHLRLLLWYRGVRLQKLHIDNSHYITDSDVHNIGTACPQLEDIKVGFSTSEEALCEIFRTVTKIRNFSHNDWNLTNGINVMRAIANCHSIETLQYFPRCTLLDALEMKFCWIHLTKLTTSCAECVPTILRQCNQLTDLTLVEYTVITQEYLEVILDQMVSVSPFLHVLDLSSLTPLMEVTYTMVQSVWAHCLCLREFYCGERDYLTVSQAVTGSFTVQKRRKQNNFMW